MRMHAAENSQTKAVAVVSVPSPVLDARLSFPELMPLGWQSWAAVSTFRDNAF